MENVNANVSSCLSFDIEKSQQKSISFPAAKSILEAIDTCQLVLLVLGAGLSTLYNLSNLMWGELDVQDPKYIDLLQDENH